MTRRAFSVALVGPDGAGKTTVARRLATDGPFDAYYLYMGDNAEAMNHSLPTTRLAAAVRRWRGRPTDAGPPDWRRSENPQRGGIKARLRPLKSLVRAANLVSEEWYRQGIAWWHQAHGRVVIFDRHFFADYFAYDVIGGRGEQTLARRLHGFVLEHAYPRPDIIVYLDAPADVLLARKGEGTIETLERRRTDYLAMRNHVRRFHVVDASRPIDDVVAQVIAALAGAGRPAPRRGA